MCVVLVPGCVLSITRARASNMPETTGSAKGSRHRRALQSAAEHAQCTAHKSKVAPGMGHGAHYSQNSGRRFRWNPMLSWSESGRFAEDSSLYRNLPGTQEFGKLGSPRIYR